MKRKWQQTLKESFVFEGIGLHSGKPVRIKFVPAEPDTGVVFVRSDLAEKTKIIALADQVTSTQRATTLGNGTNKVFTVEHILAALYLMGIDNCQIEMNSPEPPAADGSSKIYCELILKAGVLPQNTLLQYLTVEKSFQVYDQKRYITIQPYEGYRISFISENSHPELGTQFYDIELDDENGIAEIAPARTIGFVEELEILKANNLALGGSLENALVYDKDKSLNEPRFPDELVRHKILDVIGDLALCGFRIKGHVIASQSAHSLNAELAKQLQEEYWRKS